MGKVGLLVLGPAGSGKSTFCSALISHMKTVGRRCYLVNLDPAAENFEYEPTIDIKDLISLEDVMEEFEDGPNGGLVHCFEYLLDNLDWLDEQIADYEDDYLIFDCPGQIEFFTHIPILPTLISHLQTTLSFNLGVAYLLESPFVMDISKFFAGVLSATSAMVMLSLPHINILSKYDLLKNENMKRSEIKKYLEPSPQILFEEKLNKSMSPKFEELNRAIVQLVDDFHMVSFLPLDNSDEESVSTILSYVDDMLQWFDDQEPKEPKEVEPEE